MSFTIEMGHGDPIALNHHCCICSIHGLHGQEDLPRDRKGVATTVTPNKMITAVTILDPTLNIDRFIGASCRAVAGRSRAQPKLARSRFVRNRGSV